MADPRDELVFAPLGGVGEIGMNLALYGLGAPRRKTWIGGRFRRVVCGRRSARRRPDHARHRVSWSSSARTLLGIVLTHAHEDHFGALFDLWPRLAACRSMRRRSRRR